MRDKNHNILFDPIKLGPVESKNRFYQVPHCSGMGWARPNTLAAMRGIKAEGGWGVVCTEYCSVHPSSDDAPYPYARLWNKDDIKSHLLTTSKIHEHNALAGVELWLGGNFVSNLDSRIPPIGLMSRPITNIDVYHPIQSRKIDKSDIKDIIDWQKAAALRAVEAEFDIVYVYATHGYLISEFLNSKTNNRSDEYGGSLENRVRIIQELVNTTKEAVKDNCAVAVRFAVDMNDPETYDAFSILSEIPDFWDLTVPDYEIEMGVSRFVKEGSLQKNIAKAKQITSKPIVAVGRFTSPDTMANVIKKNIQDLVGAARPSISDPFLPNKIRDGRYEDIRECIGCNICYAHNSIGVPIRCTQNPTIGEEWRKGWHPEKIKKQSTKETVLVIGGGPAGLETSRVLGERNFNVLLAEKEDKLGGRINLECRLPGLSEWSRVKDWRLSQINKIKNIKVFLKSNMQVNDIFEVNPDHVIIATGAKWTTDGIGKNLNSQIIVDKNSKVINPDFVLKNNNLPKGKVVVYDDDHYYLGSVLSNLLSQIGYKVCLITPAGRVGQWGSFTEEIYRSNAELINRGVELITNNLISEISLKSLKIKCVFTGKVKSIKADWVIPITRREPIDYLYDELLNSKNLKNSNIKSINKVGDCVAPGMIANSIYSGYKAGIELGKNNIRNKNPKDL